MHAYTSFEMTFNKQVLTGDLTKFCLYGTSRPVYDKDKFVIEDKVVGVHRRVRRKYITLIGAADKDKVNETKGVCTSNLCNGYIRN